MAPATSQRAELARVFDSFVSQSGAIKDICNRAFCYSQLELHKHVIKDCDKALQLDPSRLQAYILKGHALSALGRKIDALSVWEQGYEHAQQQSADLKLLLELEELLTTIKQRPTMHSMKPMGRPNGNLTEICKNQDSLSPQDELCDNTSDKSLILLKSADNFDLRNELNSEDRESNKSDGQVNGSTDVIDKLSYNSESCNNLSDTSESRDKDKEKFVARISKTKSVSVDFQLSQGIAEVNEGKYAHAISIFDQLQCDTCDILKEDPAYPEALIGRGTAYAFKRELDAAMADFSKAIEFNPSAGEAWKRRGQARAALGGAIEDLTKALEFESNSADILHERGIANFKFKEFDAAVEDLSACVQLGRDNESAYTCLVGLALSSIGEYKKSEEAHLKSLQIDRNFLEAWEHLTQYETHFLAFYFQLCLKLLFNIILVVSFMNMRVLAVLSRFIKANKAQECLNQMLQIDGSSSGMLILFKHHRTLDIAKTVIKEKSYVYSKTDQIICLFKDGKLEEVIHANSVSDLYNVVGEDFWSSTWCNSTAFEGKQLEGTRITLGELGFDFAIRTPCTPARWEDYDAEMPMAWEALCNAYCGQNYGSTDFDVLENHLKSSFCKSISLFFRYNFMLLSRGSAVVGFVVMLGLLLAANMEFTGSIPQVTTSWKEYHDVASTFATTGSVVAALSFSND
ncbi:Suppressor of RPS4-RLD 1 [Glycine soja]|uniref:Suppressor of RPS4-RLD 1 n=2 Tax=Glycine subgen. Soja TaxID=1462606 RepID=A0A0R0HLJ3_SOYBN|nr:Suppressor of RPS4-RLD 1 [Glycine soja]